MVMEAGRTSHKPKVHNGNGHGQKVNHGFDINEPGVHNRRAQPQPQRQQSSPYANAGLLSKLTFWSVEWLFTCFFELMMQKQHYVVLSCRNYISRLDLIFSYLNLMAYYFLKVSCSHIHGT